MSILKKIKQNSVVLGCMLSELYSPNLPRILSACNLDFFILDCEHGSYDYTQVAAMAAVSINQNIDMLVRIPSITREPIVKYLDMGVNGIIAPMVSDVSDAEELVRHARYAPMGKRGISTTRAHTNYDSSNFNEYMKTANERVLLLCQIETKKAIENLAQIAATPGIDGLIAGPNDLKCDMDIQDKGSSSKLVQAIKKVQRHSYDNNLVSGIISGNMDIVASACDAKMQFISFGSELSYIMQSVEGLRKNKLFV